jgi:phosphoribosylaminoimidazole-succinocarboxamide synthase
MNHTPLRDTDFGSLTLAAKGKVRDIYAVENGLLIVSTDRLSAFDVVLPDPIPRKGWVLTQLSLFWMRMTEAHCANHLITADPAEYPEACRPYAETLAGRSMFVKKAKPFPIECVARGYLIGSGWKDYQTTGAVCGVRLPKGLRQAEKLPEPIFTPSTKAEIGSHDENISFAKAVDIVGKESADWLRDKTMELYTHGAQWAERRGVIIADTKFEFGEFEGERILIDEILTPDSSRFWPSADYRVSISPPSLDKQFVRDYLEGIAWDKKPPAPVLPPEVIAKTSEKYLQIHDILTKE